MHGREIGVTAMREGAQQVQRRRRLAIGLDLAARIRDARFRREVVAVDDVAAIARQFDIAPLLGRRRARLGELAGDAPDLHHRRAAGEGQHHRHLQKDAEEVADVVRPMLGEAFGAVAALQQESLAGANARQLLFQVAGLACKNQRRKARQLLLHGRKGRLVRVIRHLHDGLFAPAIGRPTLGHIRYSCGPRLLPGRHLHWPPYSGTRFKPPCPRAGRISGRHCPPFSPR